jgi:hypothetical protein
MRDRFQVSRVRPQVHWKSSRSRAVDSTSVRSQIAGSLITGAAIPVTGHELSLPFFPSASLRFPVLL